MCSSDLEKHDTYRHLNEFISFDIEMAWADDEDVMGVLERMINHVWGKIAEKAMHLFTPINEYRAGQGLDPVSVEVPSLPFPRLSYDDAISLIQSKGGDIEWGDDIEAGDRKSVV